MDMLRRLIIIIIIIIVVVVVMAAIEYSFAQADEILPKLTRLNKITCNLFTVRVILRRSC